VSKIYKSFDEVYDDVKNGIFNNEFMFRQAFVEALKNELASVCNRDKSRQYMVEHWLKPALEEKLGSGRADIQISNVIIELKRPGEKLEGGLEQLKRYMRELYEKSWGRIEKVYGLVTNGEEAELLVTYDGKNFDAMERGNMPNVSRRLITLFCSQAKIPVTDPRDLVMLFGV